MDAPATTLLIPPRPPAPTQALPLPAFLRAIRTNALTMWTSAAYEEDIVVRKFTHILLHIPIVRMCQHYERSG